MNVGSDAVEVVADVPVLCPVCDVPLNEHHVTKWYGRRYDLWSDRMKEQGLTCVVVDLRSYGRDPRERKAAGAKARLRRGPAKEKRR